jgi:hydroxymethylpyrimidine pyrophosphatase-like HAD family hydrolase
VLKYLEQFKSISVSNIDYLEDFCVIDINNKDVSKGNAAAFLVDYLDIDISDVMAFGDGVNDRSLFETINKGIAVGNAVEQLKTLSKEVALTCHDNGIYKYIEEHILK